MTTVRRILFVAPAAFLLAACDSTQPNATQRISLSVTAGSAHASSAIGGVLADLIVTGTGGSVKISSAKMELSRIKLADASCTAGDDDDHDAADSTHDDGDHESADSTHDDGDHESADSTHDDDDDESADSTHDDDDCPVVKAGPVVVDVPLDGTTKIFLDAQVPPGTYTGLRAKLDSVEVVGVFTDSNGTDHSFTFVSDVKAMIHARFATPVTVDANSQNLTIDVDVSTWFKDASGAIIDPTNPANQRAIEKNIRASVRGFKDDNHDGDDDHEGDGEHHGDEP